MAHRPDLAPLWSLLLLKESYLKGIVLHPARRQGCFVFSLKKKKSVGGASEMSQWVRALAYKPDSLSWILGRWNKALKLRWDPTA